jgi:Family of unknown function (DUF6491)
MLLLALLAAASPAAEAPQASIPFVDRPRSIRSFKAPADDLVYLQDRRGLWYRAELGGLCVGLRWANAIGYDTRGSLSLSRGGAIRVEGQSCMIVSLTRSDPPPRKRRK